MTTRYQEQARDVRSLLQLDLPPIALTFVDGQPSDVTQTATVSPSSCAFWRQAEAGVFYAAAAQHYNCQVGSMVMGFQLPEEVMAQLGGLVETMCGWSYLSPEEGDKIPSVASNAAGVVYGPLADFPMAPSAVVVWLTPKQAMLFNEAVGSASWAAAPARVSGRPACAAIPSAMKGELPVLSLGCAGMRTFTAIADDRMLAVVPGAKIDDFVSRLRATAESNAKMLSYYEKRLAEVTSA